MTRRKEIGIAHRRRAECFGKSKIQVLGGKDFGHKVQGVGLGV